jgi:hypothetical protein
MDAWGIPAATTTSRFRLRLRPLPAPSRDRGRAEAGIVYRYEVNRMALKVMNAVKQSVEPASKIHLEEDICVHIFSVSAAMVGVCLTVIGIIRIFVTLNKVNTLADDFLAVDAILFLVSCILSYWALRSGKYNRRHRIERFADSIFISALVIMVGVCALIAWSLLAC